jgi:hypothetical protein
MRTRGGGSRRQVLFQFCMKGQKRFDARKWGSDLKRVTTLSSRTLVCSKWIVATFEFLALILTKK